MEETALVLSEFSLCEGERGLPAEEGGREVFVGSCAIGMTSSLEEAANEAASVAYSRPRLMVVA